MKYSLLQQEVYAIFASAEWQNEDIPLSPSNFNPKSDATEFLRITILPSRAESTFGSLDCVSGLILIDVFTPVGTGVVRAHQIADVLDTYLAGKTLGNTQLFSSNFSPFGRDRDNPSLYRGIYSIPFSYYGV